MLMNTTHASAKDVLYSEIIEWIENSPFFKKRLSPFKRTLFTKNIDIGFGSRGKDSLGQATMGAIFSEINDMTIVRNQADDVFDTISTRMTTRFDGKGKDLIGHLILDSSNKGNGSFIDIRLEKKIENKINDYMLCRYAHWQAKEHMEGAYCGETFRIYAGDEHRDPFILDESSLDPLFFQQLRSERIVTVPIEHLQAFQVNIIKNIRDLAGLSTFGTWAFITNIEVLDSCFTHLNPVTQEIITLDFFDEHQTLLQFIDMKKCIFLSKAKRFIHVDLGLKNDSTGIGCSYLKDFKEVVSVDVRTGKTVVNKEPVYCLEWLMEIRCVPGHEVPIYKIKNFILESKLLGLPIGGVSTDGFQSSNLRQDLLLRGVPTDLISCDINKNPYDTLKNSILESRIELCNSSKLKKEILGLQDVGKKYDHPSDGCFTGDTFVNLFNKKTFNKLNVPFSDLTEKHSRNYYVQSYNSETCEFSYEEFSNPRVTKKVNQLIEITLEDNKVIKCTLDHLILTTVGYVKAIDLTSAHNIISYL